MLQFSRVNERDDSPPPERAEKSSSTNTLEKMKLTGTIIQALTRTADRMGGAANLGREAGVDPSNISRYLNGKVHSVSDENWHKLHALLRRRGETYGDIPCGIIEWSELQRDPDLVNRCGDKELVFRVQDQQMAPRICDGDLLVVRPAGTLGEIPENKIVVAVFSPLRKASAPAVCKRLRKINGDDWFFSDEPGGVCLPAEKEMIMWTGVVLRKICEL